MKTTVYTKKLQKYGTCEVKLSSKGSEIVLKIENVDGGWQDESDNAFPFTVLFVSNLFVGKNLLYPSLKSFSLLDIANTALDFGIPLGDCLRVFRRKF